MKSSDTELSNSDSCNSVNFQSNYKDSKRCKETNQEHDDMSVDRLNTLVNKTVEDLWNEEHPDEPRKKRKRVVATLYDKLQILKEREEGKSVKHLSQKYNLGESTILEIQKNKDKIRRFSTRASNSIHGLKNRRTMKQSNYLSLDKALLQWFQEERSAERPVSGPQCCQRARQLFPILGLGGTFDASSGWLTRWKDRHGIRCIGNTLDFIKCPEAPLEEESASNEKDQECEPEQQSLAEDNDLRNDSEEKNSEFINPNSKINIDHLTFFKFIVKKLEKVADRFEVTSKEDSVDEFGKYISSLIRKLPPVKLVCLKQKLVSEVLDAVLDHEKGLPDPIVNSDKEDTQNVGKTREQCKKRLHCNVDSETNTGLAADRKNTKITHSSPKPSNKPRAIGTRSQTKPGLATAQKSSKQTIHSSPKPSNKACGSSNISRKTNIAVSESNTGLAAAQESTKKNIHSSSNPSTKACASGNRRGKTNFHPKETVCDVELDEDKLLDEFLSKRNSTPMTTKSGRKVKPPKIIVIEENTPNKRAKKIPPRKETNAKRYGAAEEDNMDFEGCQQGEIKTEIDDLMQTEEIMIKQEIPDEEYQSEAESLSEVSDRFDPSNSDPDNIIKVIIGDMSNSSHHRTDQCTGGDDGVPHTTTSQSELNPTAKRGRGAQKRHEKMIYRKATGV